MKDEPKMTPEIMDMIRKAPAFDTQDIPELRDFKPSKAVARGFAQFKEHINRNGRPKTDDPKLNVSIRLPLSVITNLRNTGRGWQTRVGDYVAMGVNRGDIELLPVREPSQRGSV